MAEDAAGGAFRLISKFVTLLAVADICLPLGVTGSGGLGPSSAAGDSFAPAAVLALPFPNDSFHFDDFLEMDGVVELDGAREMGTEVLRRVSGGKAMPGEMGYGMGRTSEAGGGG